MKKLFSGVKPSGIIHLGNYLGAVKQWVALQDKVDEAIFCVVDMHAITVAQNPKELKKNILSIAAFYLAVGIDPEKSAIFVQSDRPEHAELAWILNCQAKIGELSRMTQFKDKTSKGGSEQSTVGLFDYPVLMAADILLYSATHVPVGEDQKQHIELTRDLAIRFNQTFGETFVVPEPMIKKETARIMGLDDPTKKMEKSAASPLNYIAMTDDADTIRLKIKKAVTDSGSEVNYSSEKPAIANLLCIYSSISGESIEGLVARFAGKGYGDFKKSLADEMVDYLIPIQERFYKIISDESKLKGILLDGSERIALSAKEMIEKVKNKVGLGI